MAIHYLVADLEDWKTLKKTPAKCLVCGEYSECEIIRYEKSFRVFYIKIRTLETRYHFRWERCRHVAELYDQEDAARYKREHEDTGLLSVPDYQTAKLNIRELPDKKTSNMQLALVLIISTVITVLCIILAIKFNLPLP